MRQYPLFTVIIPQKDRAEYLFHTIRTCMIQDYPNFEIIISDDCSVDNSIDVVTELMKIDSRIKLFAHKEHLGMRNNFEFALNQVKPGYVIALGGDDGLIPGCIWKMNEILQSTKRELLAWPLASFSYPDNDSKDNIFSIKRNCNKGIKIIKTADFFREIKNNFNYLIDECPMFYMKGVVSTELIDKVKSRSSDNCFYHCPTPDGFSGVVLAGEVNDYVFSYEPLTIGGTTTKSQGKNYHRTDKKSREEAEQFFNDNISRTMHKDLASQAYSPLITLMTADYLLTASDLPEWPGTNKIGSIDFEKLIIKTFKFIETCKFDNDVLKRELLILKNIAIQHNQIELYNKLLTSTRRKYPPKGVVFGPAITNSLRLNGSELHINNIFDAAIAVPFLINCYKKFSIKIILQIILNSCRIILRSKKYTIGKLPFIE